MCTVTGTRTCGVIVFKSLRSVVVNIDTTAAFFQMSPISTAYPLVSVCNSGWVSAKATNEVSNSKKNELFQEKFLKFDKSG